MRHLVHNNQANHGEVKTVTIRDVNKSLYDRFSQLSTRFGDNTGQIFSHMISSYGKQYHPSFLPPGIHRMMMAKHDHSQVEVISDLEELVISKEDLEEAGQEVRYIFRNIGQLSFDKSVNNKVLMKYVVLISHSNVISKGEISKLFLKSINQGRMLEDHYRDLDQNTTNVTIRNVSERTYSEFTATCHANKTKIGDAVNSLLKRALPHFEISQIMIHDPKIDPLDMIVLTMHEELVISNQDLLDLEGRNVLFHRIKKISFEPDVTAELFKEKVLGLYNCDIVNFPDSIPRLLQLSRVKTYP